MIINKIIIGFVIQSFDTEKDKFIHQEFVSSDDISFEDAKGNQIFTEIANELPCDMVQPILVN
jgi:hypothetical protein